MRLHLYREYLFLKYNTSLAIIAVGIFVLFCQLLHWIGVEASLSPAHLKNMLWLLSLIGLFLTADHVFKEDIDQGLLMHHHLENVNFYILTLMRFFSYFLLVILPLALSNIMISGLFNLKPSLSDFSYFLVLFCLYAFVILNASLLTHGSQQQKGLMFLISIPLMIPIFLCQVILLDKAALYLKIDNPLLLLAGLFLFFVPCYSAMVMYCLKLSVKVS